MTDPDEAHFKSIPWCSQILQDAGFIITPTFSRQPKPDTEDSLIAETLQSNNTIKACLSVYKRPAPGVSWIEEVRTLVTLGTGMNGAALVLHGGIVATLMDDVAGTLLTVNKYDKPNQSGKALPLSANTVTAYLNVQYLKPVKTPQTVLIVARCLEAKGRKFFMEAEVKDGDGNVLAKGDSLWIRVLKGKL
jgi:acyl-coenzyme A thioesterase PaaI-like protein